MPLLRHQLQHLLRSGACLSALLWLSACAWASQATPATGSPTEQRAPASGVRTWLGPTLWGNRLQDWRAASGRIECVTPLSSKFGWLPMRTAHELSRRVDARRGNFELSVVVELLTPAGSRSDDALGGLLVGAGGPSMDPRSAALIHHWPRAGFGLLVALDARGSLHIRDMNAREDPDEVSSAALETPAPASFRLNVRVERQESGELLLSAVASEKQGGRQLASCSRLLPAASLVGNVALLSHPGSFRKKNQPARFGFTQLSVQGAGSLHDESASLGAIIGTQYTISRGVLKLTAQLMPMSESDPREVSLEVLEQGHWKPIAESELSVASWTASFRVPSWDASRELPYRVRYGLPVGDGSEERIDYLWSGTLRADPSQKQDVLLAVLNCNHNNSHAISAKAPMGQAPVGQDPVGQDPEHTQPGEWTRGMWFPHAEITRAVSAKQPDLLFFAGD